MGLLIQNREGQVDASKAINDRALTRARSANPDQLRRRERHRQYSPSRGDQNCGLRLTISQFTGDMGSAICRPRPGIRGIGVASGLNAMNLPGDLKLSSWITLGRAPKCGTDFGVATSQTWVQIAQS